MTQIGIYHTTETYLPLCDSQYASAVLVSEDLGMGITRWPQLLVGWTVVVFEQFFYLHGQVPCVSSSQESLKMLLFATGYGCT